MQNIRIAKLVLDWNLYPRHEVDSVQVGRMAAAIEMGEEMPPILVDRASLRVVDGFHRIHARRRALGDDASIAAILKTYKAERDMFLEAVRVNARHGVPLESMDQARSIIIADELGIALDVLAEAIAVPQAKLEDIKVSKIVSGPGGEPVILKQGLIGVIKPGGRRMTKGQVGANDRLIGMNQSYFVGRVLDLLRHNLVDWENERLVTLLRELAKELESVLAKA